MKARAANAIAVAIWLACFSSAVYASFSDARINIAHCISIASLAVASWYMTLTSINMRHSR